MRIALVYPSFCNPKNQPNLKAVADNYGVFPPLSLAQVAAVMQEGNHDVRIIDANANNLSLDAIIREIKHFKPDLIGFTLTTYLLHHTLSQVKYIKERINIPVLAGGVHLSIYPYETLKHKEIDYGFIGEANKEFLHFLDTLEKGKDISKCQGILYKKNGKVILKRSKYVDKNLDKLPFPARSLLDNSKYYSFISQRKNFTAMVTSRGCPFKCIFCEQGRKQYYARSPQNVVDEMEECYYNYGVREVDVFDPTFTIDKKRVIEITKEIRKRNIDIDWAIRTRLDLVDKEILFNLAKARCKRIYYGIESGDEKILRNIRKLTNFDLIKKNVSLTKKAGIDVFGYFMIGNPGETKETVLKTIKFAKSLKLDFAQFAKVSTLPNTELYNMLMKETRFDYWREFTEKPEIDFQLPRYGTNLSEKEIENLTKKSYIDFYLRPGYILKRIANLKSFHELYRYVKSGVNMLLR